MTNIREPHDPSRLTVWRPGHMVVEPLSMRATEPWRPEHLDWVNVQTEAAHAIVRAINTSWRAQLRKGCGNG